MILYCFCGEIIIIIIIIIIILIIIIIYRLFGVVVRTSICYPRDPGFDFWLYPGNFSGSIGFGTGSTQSREDNCVATYMRSSEIWLRKLELRLRDNALLTTRPHVLPAIWQQPHQSVLALRSCSATYYIIIIFIIYYILG